MPTKPLSHEQLLRAQRRHVYGRACRDREYREHRGDDPAQREADRLRTSGRWKRARQYKLQRAPLCERCRREGRVVPASDVNHRVPVVDLVRRGESHRAFELQLLESICRRHHNIETRREVRARREGNGSE